MDAAAIRAIIKDFDKDWIPMHSPGRGHPARVHNVRPAQGLERCCACVCNDIQSGMIYCGRLAEVMADVVDAEGCIIAYCEYHKRRMRDHEEATSDS